MPVLHAVDDEGDRCRAAPVDDGAAPGGCALERARFADLYRRHYARIVQLCETRLGDPYAAEDAAQDALVRAFRFLDRYDPARPFWPWVRAIAVNMAAEHARRAAREPAVDTTSEEAAEAPGMAVPPVDVAQALVVREALAALPPRQRAALVLRYADDWSTADSAMLYGMRVVAFEQLLWRARRRLARQLAAGCAEPGRSSPAHKPRNDAA